MAEGKQEGAGSSPAGTIGIVILTFCLVSLSLALFYRLYALWPRPAALQVGLLRNTVEGVAVLAVIFYLVIRGGFFSAESNPQHISPFGFMALSAMVGMFSEQAVLKLKEIAETVLSKAPAGKDSKPQSKADDAKVAQSTN